MDHDIYRKSYEANSTQRENSKLILYDLMTLENKNLFCRKLIDRVICMLFPHCRKATYPYPLWRGKPIQQCQEAHRHKHSGAAQVRREIIYKQV